MHQLACFILATCFNTAAQVAGRHCLGDLHGRTDWTGDRARDGPCDKRTQRNRKPAKQQHQQLRPGVFGFALCGGILDLQPFIRNQLIKDRNGTPRSWRGLIHQDRDRFCSLVLQAQLDNLVHQRRPGLDRLIQFLDDFFFLLIHTDAEQDSLGLAVFFTCNLQLVILFTHPRFVFQQHDGAGDQGDVPEVVHHLIGCKTLDVVFIDDQVQAVFDMAHGAQTKAHDGGQNHKDQREGAA
ncbi:hypothetical protein D9M73_96060 [compost metagenome]